MTEDHRTPAQEDFARAKALAQAAKDGMASVKCGNEFFAAGDLTAETAANRVVRNMVANISGGCIEAKP